MHDHLADPGMNQQLELIGLGCLMRISGTRAAFRAMTNVVLLYITLISFTIHGQIL